MNAAELRTFVREVLHDELSQHGGTATTTTSSRVEDVTLRSDSDLMAFVRRIVQLAGDTRQRHALESGQLAFRLAHGPPVPSSARAGADGPQFEAGLVTERHIEGLDESVAHVTVAPAVRFTPLALDRLRQRGISVKRIKS